jgi:hypothetical protein
MNLIITPSTSLASIQAKFNKMFPYLKLEFYQPIEIKGNKNENRYLYHKSTRLFEIIDLKGIKVLNISEFSTINAIKELFSSQLKLEINIFRKSRNGWLNTEKTNEWSLKRQNLVGEEISTSFQISPFVFSESTYGHKKSEFIF